MPLDITYVMLSAGMSGGGKIALEQATRLEQRGHNVCVYYLWDSPDWFCRRVPGVHFADLESLKRALRATRGIKVATWHETAYWVADSLNPGDLGYYLVQDIEESYYSNPKDARRALDTYRLGLQPIGSGLWPWRQLTSRFGLKALLVRPPVDFDIFYPVPIPRERSRIFTQCRPLTASGQGHDLKGWGTARAAVERAFQLDPSISLVTFSIEAPQQFPPGLPHIHLTPSDDQLRELYSQAGVYLMSSNHEGFGLTAAEAMACGCPVVATRCDGNEEFCRDGFTALTAPPGDYETLARHCLTLLHNPEYAERLARNAREFIQQYSWDTYVDHLEAEFQRHSLPVELRPPAPRGPEIEHALTPPPLAAEPAVGEYPNLVQDRKPACEVSVVIPTINDVEHVLRCVRTCREHSAGHTVEYLVVDDGSTDPAVIRRLQEESRKLDFRLLRNYQNLGFAASVNHGIRQSRGEFVVLVNNDVRFFQPWLEPMLDFMRHDPSTAVVGAKLLFEADSSIQHGGMTKAPGMLWFPHRCASEPRTDYRSARSDYVWAVTGALFMIRRSALKELGGLSTAYGTAWEDVDYCLYAWTRGYRVAYCGEAVAYHGEGKTRGASDVEKSRRPLHWLERERAGKAYFAKKWFWLTDLEDFPINSQETLRGAPVPLEGRLGDPASFFPTSSLPLPAPAPPPAAPPMAVPQPVAAGAGTPSSNGRAPMPAGAYELLIAGVRAAVSATIPQHASVVVVSRGDDALLDLDGRPGWHFPQDADGTWAGYYPADSEEAIVHLESLRARGAAFLLFPNTAFWWLEHYDGFRQHLDERYSVVRRDALCVIYALREPKSNGHIHEPALTYPQIIQGIREVASGALPAGATVAVVSKGDDDLLRLNGCRAWHFPQTDDGTYSGYYPADSVEAIGQLEIVRGKGASHLLFPDTSLWWLDHYDRFRQHLDTRYRRVWSDGPCVIYDLRSGGDPAASGERPEKEDPPSSRAQSSHGTRRGS